MLAHFKIHFIAVNRQLGDPKQSYHAPNASLHYIVKQSQLPNTKYKKIFPHLKKNQCWKFSKTVSRNTQDIMLRTLKTIEHTHTHTHTQPEDYQSGPLCWQKP